MLNASGSAQAAGVNEKQQGYSLFSSEIVIEICVCGSNEYTRNKWWRVNGEYKH